LPSTFGPSAPGLGTNLAIASELLRQPRGRRARQAWWTIQRTNAPNTISLTRIGEWTVVGVGPEKNPLFAEITARILRDAAPLAGRRPISGWKRISIRRASQAFWDALPLWPKNMPRVSFNVTGDGGNVIVHGQLTFGEPLPIQLEPWHIPWI